MGRPQPAEEEVRDAVGAPASAAAPVAVDDGTAARPPLKRKAEPERTCAVTREKLTPPDLIRFVRAPDGTITPDLANRLPGRGVWLSLDATIVDKAARQNAFARSLKQPVIVPEALSALVEKLLLDRCIQALAMANKAGSVVAGFAKVESAIGTGSVAALVHAADASADGSAKLDGKLRASLARAGAAATAAVEGESSSVASVAASPELRGPAIVTDLVGHELSLALGRENVVHAAVIRGGAARYFLTEVERLRRYRSPSSAAAGRPHRTRPNTEQV